MPEEWKPGMEIGVSGLGFRAWGLGFGIWGFRVWGVFGVWGWFGVWGLGIRVWGLRFSGTSAAVVELKVRSQEICIYVHTAK